MLRRLIYRLGAAALLSVVTVPVMVATVATPANALVACSTTTVADDAAILDDAKVLSAAKKVDAKVHVITFTSTPGKNIDKAVEEYRVRCGADSAKSLVLAIAVKDRTSGVYYGGGLSDKLDAKWERINSAMQAQFPDDFTLGVTKALKKADSLLSASASAPVDEYEDEYEDEYAPGMPAIDDGFYDEIEPEPMDVPWAWLLGVPLGGAVLGGGGYGAFVYRRRVLARNGARASALALTNAAALAFDGLDNARDLTVAHVAGLPDVRDSVLDELRTESETVTKLVDDAITTYLAHTDTWPDSKIAAADFENAVAAEESAREAQGQIESATKTLADFDTKLDDLEAQFAAAPKALDNVDKRLAGALDTADGLDADGYRTEAYRAGAAAIAKQVAEARTAHSTNQWGRAVTLADDASDKVNRLDNALNSLRRRRTELVENLSALRARHASMGPAITTATATATQVSGTYHSECSTPAETAAATAVEAHAMAPSRIDAGEKAVDMSVQDFDQADSEVADANRLLDSAAANIEEVSRIEAELASLTDNLPVEVTALRKEAGQLEGKMGAHREAMKFLPRQIDLDKITKALTAAGADLGSSHPRLYSLRTSIGDAAKLISSERRTVDETVAAYDEAVSLIAKAESAVRDAERETSRANAGSSSRSILSDAERSLSAARSWSSLSQVHQDANDAIRKAADAETRARRAIREHEEEEQRRRRRAAAAAAASSSSSFGSSGGGSSFGGGGGGSSSWGGGGSSSGGGGGSSSW